MDLWRMFGNWKTALSGIVVIAVSALDSFLYDIPQWTLGFTESIPIAIGLIVAKDATTGSPPGETS
jgi:hypothetical protein